MKLITKEIERKLLNSPLYSQEEKDPETVPIIVKFFGGGRGSWFVTEAEKCDEHGWMFFGYVKSPLGPDCDELGYFTFAALATAKFPPFGLGIERDMYHKGTLADAMQKG